MVIKYKNVVNVYLWHSVVFKIKKKYDLFDFSLIQHFNLFYIQLIVTGFYLQSIHLNVSICKNAYKITGAITIKKIRKSVVLEIKGSILNE